MGIKGLIIQPFRIPALLSHPLTKKEGKGKSDNQIKAKVEVYFSVSFSWTVLKILETANNCTLTGKL